MDCISSTHPKKIHTWQLGKDYHPIWFYTLQYIIFLIPFDLHMRQREIRSHICKSINGGKYFISIYFLPRFSFIHMTLIQNWYKKNGNENPFIISIADSIFLIIFVWDFGDKLGAQLFLSASFSSFKRNFFLS